MPQFGIGRGAVPRGQSGRDLDRRHPRKIRHGRCSRRSCQAGRGVEQLLGRGQIGHGSGLLERRAGEATERLRVGELVLGVLVVGDLMWGPKNYA